MMLFRWFSAICLLVMSISLSAAQQEYQDPYQLVEDVATDVFTRVKTEQVKLEQDPSYAEQIVREDLLFYVDIKYSAYKVIGPELKNTTPAQREAFVEAFRDHMVITYSNVLFQYDEQTLKLGSRKNVAGQKIVSVPVSFVQEGAPEINVVFKLRAGKSQDKSNKTPVWRVFDVVTEGVSLLTTKQSELGGLIRKQGIDKVTEQLIAKNKAMGSSN
ncbi:phospholipid-binding protein MlaC [Motilimonas sp. KMU-193]|uniref:MlaC/ttg2D family ABC transporter substrate-binding protein n=1 Tax=Motilimonas sp. KMU-193 TaxID=3388668 RepID=UPI00396B1022